MRIEPLSAAPDRKADHLALASREDVLHLHGPGLDAVRLRHRALPGRDLDEVALGTDLLGRPLRVPIMVSAMTGGTPAAAVLNDRLAAAAAAHGAAMTLGSGRALLEDPALLRTYRPADRPPLLLANLGVAKLHAGAAERLVEMLDADGLVVHLNPIQEAVQPEGQPCFADAIERIAAVAERLAPLPVVAKEVGFGLDGEDAAQLALAGVAAIDVAGAGGTNWALVEGQRDRRAREVAEAFAGWGVATAEALVEVRAAAPGVPVIASGGLRDGVQVAKCLALGAVAGGLARSLLLAAQDDRATDALGTVVEQLRIATWAAGAPSAGALGPEHLR